MAVKIIPVIHYHTEQQAFDNASLAYRYGCFGVFVIAMTTANDQQALQTAQALKHKHPDLRIGINLLSEPPAMRSDGPQRPVWT